MKRSISAELPYKINLHLAIKERRSDGFHNLESIFLALKGGDRLSIRRLRKTGQVDFRAVGMEARPDNLVLKALSLFRQATGIDEGLRIYLKKRVPIASGLGGGSANAAGTLVLLNTLFKKPLSEKEIFGLAKKLGSDVPFFLHGGSAYVSGRGEIIETLEVMPSLWALVIYPSIHSDTATAYALLNRARKDGFVGPEPMERSELIAALSEPPASWPYYNDFLPLFLAESTAQATRYRHLLEDFKETNADFIGLTGAGSACFGLYSDKKAGENAYSILKKRWKTLHFTIPLARGTMR